MSTLPAVHCAKTAYCFTDWLIAIELEDPKFDITTALDQITAACIADELSLSQFIRILRSDQIRLFCSPTYLQTVISARQDIPLQSLLEMDIDLVRFALFLSADTTARLAEVPKALLLAQGLKFWYSNPDGLVSYHSAVFGYITGTSYDCLAKLSEYLQWPQDQIALALTFMGVDQAVMDQGHLVSAVHGRHEELHALLQSVMKISVPPPADVNLADLGECG